MFDNIMLCSASLGNVIVAAYIVRKVLQLVSMRPESPRRRLVRRWLIGAMCIAVTLFGAEVILINDLATFMVIFMGFGIGAIVSVLTMPSAKSTRRKLSQD